MLPAIAWAVASSSILYVMSPRMPSYQVTSLRVMTVSVTSYVTWHISATIRAGIRIQNENFIGADVHAAVVDIFYPDLWTGTLRHIGQLRDAAALPRVEQQHEKEQNNEVGTVVINNNRKNDSTNGICEDPMEDYDDDRLDAMTRKNAKKESQCPASSSIPRGGGTGSTGGGGEGIKDGTDQSSRITRNSDNENTTTTTKQEPILTIHPRRITHSVDDLISITLHDVPPSTYINVLRDALSTKGGGRGTIHIPSAGVAHIKSTMSLPLTLGIMCDNTVNLFARPMQITGRECVVESLATGWLHIGQHGHELREEAMRRYTETGSVVRRKKNQSGGGGKEDRTEQIVLDWHTF